MDVSNGLDSVLSRRSAESSERAAEARSERRRESQARAAEVDLGEAASQKEEVEPPPVIDPAAVFDRLRQQDTQHLINLVV